MSIRRLREAVAGQSALTGMADDRLITAMRLGLSFSALLVIAIDPSEPNRFVAFTYTILVLYTIYSALLYFAALRGRMFRRDWAHWADIAWYAILVFFTDGANSVFFFGFFFPVLVASFRWGSASGLRVTVVAAVIFSAIGYATASTGRSFELNRLLLRPISLLALGYMISRWGGYQVELARRLTLLKEISRLSNPRFGIDWTIGAILERILAFYRADACLMILADDADGERAGLELRRATAADPTAGKRITPVPEELAENLLGGSDGKALAAWLDAESFISITLEYHHRMHGRLFVAARGGLDASDTEFLGQISEHIKPVIDNIRLVDHLASKAAEEERRRIARDLHDSVIQPYIGLQMGLAAIRLRLNNVEARNEIGRLMEITESGIANLRHYISDLKAIHEETNSLVLALRRFAARFTETTGIVVDVEAEADLPLNDRLSAEIFQMVVEGLSNVRRHTGSAHAGIRFEHSNNRVSLRIENNAHSDAPVPLFIPRSISERAEALGGEVRVDLSAQNKTAVQVEILL